MADYGMLVCILEEGKFLSVLLICFYFSVWNWHGHFAGIGYQSANKKDL